MNPLSLIVTFITLGSHIAETHGDPKLTPVTTLTPSLPTTTIITHVQKPFTELPLTQSKPREDLGQLKGPANKETDKNHLARHQNPSTGRLLSTSRLVQLNGTVISTLIHGSPGDLTNSSRLGRNKSHRLLLRGLQTIPPPDYGISGNNEQSSSVNGVEGSGVISDDRVADSRQTEEDEKPPGGTDKTGSGERDAEKSSQRNMEKRPKHAHSQMTMEKPTNSTASLANQSDSITFTATTTTTTKKPIYIRGHRLQQVPPPRGSDGNRQKKTEDKESEDIKTPASMISHYGYPTHRRTSSSNDHREPCGEANNCDSGNDGHQVGDNGSGDEGETEPVRNKRKHINHGGNKILGYNNENNKRIKPNTASVYGWIIAAAMLTVGSLVSLTGGVLLCFCGEKWKKMREERRRLEKYGEYERVESVSSLVSHVTSTDLHDDQLESVSMI